jgi:hypothetical protein
MQGDNGVAELKELEATFKDCNYTFRHFPNSQIAMLR